MPVRRIIEGVLLFGGLIFSTLVYLRDERGRQHAL